MKEVTIKLKVGDEILVGRFRNVNATIKDISLDDHGQPVVHTSKGKKKALGFRISKGVKGK
jgi:molybdopterin-biosynthesis enzyme MoeA-like protein